MAPMRRPIPFLALIAVLTAAACGTSAPTATPGPTSTSTAGMTSTRPASTAPGSTVSASLAPDHTVWLCKPGIADNPCEGSLDATSIDAAGTATLQPASPAADPPIDCFYVYPTVSRQTTVNANLTIDPEERAVAVAQAARFSQVCRVYAPMYPQLTLAAISQPQGITLAEALPAYQGVESAFRDYLTHYNNGRGVVFIGHSQGASILIGLLRLVVDGDPSLRHLVVSALLMGGNVTVPIGKTVGGDFQIIPACASSSQTGCVVAYSSFDQTPPADAFFGRPGSGLNPFATGSASSSQILCVNPAAPGGGTATLQPYFPSKGVALLVGGAAATPAVSTPFVTYPGLYSAHCMSSGGATWLQIDRIAGPSDHRPAIEVGQAPQWGLHVVDVNIALGNLVELVRSESAAYG